jgi:hypothetical protein
MRIPGRRDCICRIERDIAGFQTRAGELLESEQIARDELEHAERRAAQPSGRMRRTWRMRALRRAQRTVQRRADEREVYVEQALRAIMLTLGEQSQRTRERLDRELDRLAPIQDDWERLRGAFGSLEKAVATPAVEQLADQWHGRLEIPEFPVQEREGYLKPFPRGALLF